MESPIVMFKIVGQPVPGGGQALHYPGISPLLEATALAGIWNQKKYFNIQTNKIVNIKVYVELVHHKPWLFLTTCLFTGCRNPSVRTKIMFFYNSAICGPNISNNKKLLAQIDIRSPDSNNAVAPPQPAARQQLVGSTPVILTGKLNWYSLTNILQ